MDPPTERWLWNWFVAINVAFGIAMLATIGLKLTLLHRRSFHLTRFVFAAFAIVSSLVTGTIASVMMDDFVFTWPGAVFVSFQLAIPYVLLTRQGAKPKPRLDVYSGLLFIITSVAYFFACRQLSLVTEWVFLCGFVAALPSALAARWTLSRNGWNYRLLEIALFYASFIAFYGGGVLMLCWNYEISRH